MSTGIKLPVELRGGGAVLVSEDAYVEQIVRLALTPGDAEHPFEEYGRGEEVIFALGDGASLAETRMRVTSAFERLRHAELAELVNVSFSSVEGTGETEMLVQYRNMRTGQAGEYRAKGGG